MSIPRAGNEGFRLLDEFDCRAIPESSQGNPKAAVKHAAATANEEALAPFKPRKRAIFKLRSGCLPLTEVELAKVPPESRKEAKEVKPRSLREVARLFGVSKERIRQIEAWILVRLHRGVND